MARVRMLTTTYHAELEPRRLGQGLALDVDDETARRWVKNRIAEAWSGPTGQVEDAVAHASTDELEAQIAKLEAIRAARAADQENQVLGHPPALPDEEPNPTAAAYRTDEHPLARYDLTEQQRVNLERAGFDRPEKIDAATLEDLQEIDQIGPATLARLRPDLARKG